ncbi:putative bifunctional diguanylate cyclase/phosphodiesterase [Acidisoma silvae]|uniref:EAL domain-containing protein n=1 Tax=Acidisoma silvae TaxID=2802396 RepID=A0A964E1I3_9PROT|nr:EAL domain-containing protein [Acidisoma silvae]MCB8877803.1 EAL domain-containing protein [Acidisoma silvae]
MSFFSGIISALVRPWAKLKTPTLNEIGPKLGKAILLFVAILAVEYTILHYMGNDTPIWLTNAIAVTAVFRSPTKSWPALILAEFGADITAVLLYGDPVTIAVGTAFTGSLEIIVVSLLLKRIFSRAPLFSNLEQISSFAAVCITVPIVSTGAGAAVVTSYFGGHFLSTWFNWYIAGAFDLLVITPFLLLWTDSAQWRQISKQELLRVSYLGLLVGLVGWVDFRLNFVPGTYFSFPFLLLAAFRGGILGAVTSSVVLTIVATSLTVTGYGPFRHYPNVSHEEQVLFLQIYLAFVVLSTLPVAAILEHRKLLNAAQALADQTRLGRYDVLTDLPNRVLFSERLKLAQDQAAYEHGTASLLVIDLDRFKPVNDLHGHIVGDQLLQLVAKRLSGIVDNQETTARLGGDEFSIVSYPSSEEAAEHLAERIISEIGKTFEVQGLSIQIGCCIGIAMSMGAAIAETTLMTRADAALYDAKAAGRNGYRFYEPGQDIRLRERAELESELRVALKQHEIQPHYQPIVALSDGTLVGFEMLARWKHGTKGNVPPSIFIPLAEAIGLIEQMTDQLIHQACQAALSWPDHVFIAVNVSPVQLRHRRLPALIAAALTETGMPATRLHVELTESALIDDFEMASSVLADLKAMGISLSLDDFGTGYSSLRHLQRLPFDKLKIDMEFVRTMNCTEASRKIVASIINLGHSFGLHIVAEGIDSLKTAEMLKRMNCDFGQGWLFGKAMPLDEATLFCSQANHLGK